MRNQHRTAQQLPLFTLITLYTIIFLGSAGFFITIPAYVSLFLTDHSLEFAKSMPIEQRRMLFGTVMSVAPFISMFFTPFIARFADKFSRKTVIAICLMIAAIGFALPIYAIVVSSVIILFVGNMINSLGSASQPIAQAILADNSEGKNKATLMSLVAVVMTAAMSFGPALGSKLSASYGAQAPFYACLLIAIVSLALLFIIRLPIQNTVKEENPFSFAKPLKRSQKGLLNCLFIVFICQFSWSLYFQNITFIFPQKWNIAVESEFYQYFMMGIGIVMIFSLLLLPRLILKRFSVSSALRVTTALSAMGMLLLAITPTPTSHVSAMIFTATMVALCFPLYITALSDRASDIDQGWAMALSSAMVGLAWTLTGYLTAMMVNVHLLLPTGIAVIGYLAAMVMVPTQNTTTEKKTPSELEVE
ncbi:MFS transporter [Photobacterium leiognathi subsp. mandapamensis]|uniref:MFS transporter n=1 Tax=Photobacterium leiognathi TaxID=553611 RepID=UPI000D177AD9|nr:MFS transporter [Photobacterium leiognathi]PSU96326.1 MFS transporter [Photobacterium leiognathi subsp. mandapamensis]